MLQWRSRHCVSYLEVTVNPLQKFLEERRASYGTLQALAVTMDISFSGFLRGVKKGTLSVENLLKLAEVLGEEPASVFRAADQTDLADQFDRLYGKTVNPMTEQERELIDTWRGLSPSARQLLREMVFHLAQRSRERTQAIALKKLKTESREATQKRGR